MELFQTPNSLSNLKIPFKIFRHGLSVVFVVIAQVTWEFPSVSNVQLAPCLSYFKFPF